MDPFNDMPNTLTTPARDATAVVPSDTVDLTVTPRAIYVGVTGHVSATMPGGQTVTLQNVAGGTLLPVRAQRINATGTTASGIIAFW